MNKEYDYDYIDALAREFEWMLKLDKNSKHDEMVLLAMNTMLYHIADEYEDGKHRDKILSKFKDKLK